MRLTQKEKEAGVNIWKLWGRCTLAFLTCLHDSWFWRDLRDSVEESLRGLLILVGKVACTLLAPIPGLMVAIHSKKKNQKYLNRLEPLNENNKS